MPEKHPAATDPAALPTPPPEFRSVWHGRHGTRLGTRQFCRSRERKGSMIRHARGCRPLALPKLGLAVAVIQPAFRAALVATIGATLLLQAGLPPALVAAVAMSAITVRADVEARLTRLPAARSLEQNGRSMHCRIHGGRRRDWTTAAVYVRLDPVSLGIPDQGLPTPEPYRVNGRVPSSRSVTIPRWRNWGIMDAPSARMRLSSLGNPENPR